MLRKYETLILATPEISADEAKTIESHLDRVLKKNESTMTSFDRWGKYRLAYPVNGNEYGVYYLMRYETEQNIGALNTEVNNLFKIKYSELVLRNMTSVLEPDAPSNYNRPKSLEETSSRDVDSFIKENKMEGLLHSSENKSSRFENKEDADDSDIDGEDLGE